MKKRTKKTINSIKEFFINVYKAIMRPEMVILPGNLAFFFVLAIIPSLSLLSYGASMLNLSVDYLYNFFSTSFSPEIANIILSVKYVNTANITFFITLGFGFFFASNGADSMIRTSNTIYGIKNKTWLKRRIKAIGITVLLIILLIFMLIVPVFGNNIVGLIEEVNLNTNVTAKIVAIFKLLKGPISWIVMFIIIRIIYLLAPDERRNDRVINYGAIFTTIGFILGTKIYALYANNIADYTVLYGNLAHIVMLMIWIYYLSYIFTIGIALNCRKDELKMLKNGSIKIEE